MRHVVRDGNFMGVIYDRPKEAAPPPHQVSRIPPSVDSPLVVRETEYLKCAGLQ